MLFMHPVVVNEAGDAAVARPVPAKVRMAEPRAAAPTWTEWNGVVLAQSSLDQRSPFGANAADNNAVTPGATAQPVPPATFNTPDVPGSATGATSSSTQPAATPGRPDAGPPVTGAGTATTPPAAAPGAATPSSTPGGSAGTGNATGTMRTPSSPMAPPPAPANINQPSSSTFPGAGQTTLPGGTSGASNSR